VAIQSFRDSETEAFFLDGSRIGRFQSFENVAMRKLQMVHAATRLLDLSRPPGNRLEALHGNREGQHGIRINDQWRICFKFEGGNAYEVEIINHYS
jgi:toxin HigB-1